MTFLLAVFQGGLPTGTTDENLALMETTLQTIQQQAPQVSLIVFPECFLQGYVGGKGYFERFAEENDGTASKKVSALAQKYQVAIIYGYTERDKATLYNSAQCISKSGKTLLNYRKTHLWLDYEKGIWTPGDELENSICEVEGHKIGLLICFDIEFPEPCRILAIKGAELVVAIAACCSPEVQKILVPARAYENTTFVCYVNRVGLDDGKSFPGGTEAKFAGTCIVSDPCGNVLATTNDSSPQHVTVKLDFENERYTEARKQNPYFKDRRPSLYKSIL